MVLYQGKYVDDSAVLASVGGNVQAAQYATEDERSGYLLGMSLGADFASQITPDMYLAREEMAGYDGEYPDCEGYACEVAGEVFENYQQFSPWEQNASYMNSLDNADDVWSAFNEGMSWGARYVAFCHICGFDYDMRKGLN